MSGCWEALGTRADGDIERWTGPAFFVLAIICLLIAGWPGLFVGFFCLNVLVITYQIDLEQLVIERTARLEALELPQADERALVADIAQTALGCCTPLLMQRIFLMLRKVIVL